MEWSVDFSYCFGIYSTFTGIFNREKQDTKSMDVDFVIPLSKDDLLSGEAGCYVVDEVLSARVLPNKLRGWEMLSYFLVCFGFLYDLSPLLICLQIV